MNDPGILESLPPRPAEGRVDAVPGESRVVRVTPATVRWPAAAAWFTAWLRPGTTAVRTQHVSLASAWLVHFVAGLLAALLMIALVGILDRNQVWGLADIPDAIGAGINELWDEFGGNLFAFVFAVGGTALLIEVEFALAAVAAAPWGARDESLRDSVLSGIRRTWLQTSALPYALLFIGLVAYTLNVARLNWEANHPSGAVPRWPTAPAQLELSPSEAGYAKARAEYDAAMAEYNKQVTEYWREWPIRRAQQPWYVREPQPAIVFSAFAVALWCYWGLFRAVGAPREVIPIARPPTCEACGYNLTTLAADARCPECGETVESSLGAGSRMGSPWERRTMVGAVTSAGQTALSAIHAPAVLGRSLRLRDDDRNHRVFFALHLPLILLIGAASLLLVISSLDGGSIWDPGIVLPLLVAFVFGSTCVFGAIAFTLSAVSLVGLVLSWREKRNLLPGAMRMGCYLAPYLALWAVFGALTGWLAMSWTEEGLFRVWAQNMRMSDEFLAFVCWVVPNLACSIYYLVLLTRGTNATRYANR